MLLLLQGSSGMLLAVAQPCSPALGLLHVEEHAARSIISIAADAHALNALRVLLLKLRRAALPHKIMHLKTRYVRQARRQAQQRTPTELALWRQQLCELRPQEPYNATMPHKLIKVDHLKL